MNQLQKILQISSHFKWFFLFFFFFAIITHVVTCFWIIAGKMALDDSWIEEGSYDDLPPSELYLTSFYFTITTITTVGYGDLSAQTYTEKVFCIFIMLIGVISFSFASGALTNYISFQDRENAVCDKKLKVLDKLFVKHAFPQELYTQIKKNVKSNYIKNVNETSSFVESLPLNMRTRLCLHIYEPVYSKVEFLKTKSQKFLGWICP